MQIIANPKTLIRTFTDAVWRNRDVDAIDVLMHPEYSDPEIESPGRENLKVFFRRYFNLRPDFRVTSEDLIAEGECVVQYITGTFTNTEPVRGPVGAAMAMHEINMFWLRDGLIARHIGIGRSWVV